MPSAPDPFSCVSPADYRYWREGVALYMSEQGNMNYLGRVELALSRSLSIWHICDSSCTEEIERAIPNVKAADVYEEEGRIGHDINAYNNVLGRMVSPVTRRFIHLGATSSDKIDTANAARTRDCVDTVIIPHVKALVTELVIQAIRHANTGQIGRSHLQHGLPITFGFSLLKYIAGLTDCLEELRRLIDLLPGQMSGGMGGYHGHGIFIDDPESFERSVLLDLSLTPGFSSTQVTLTQPMQRVLNELQNIGAILADMGDDFRYLQAPEIAETAEPFKKDQQGSSTMKHKQNPITWENAVGLWRILVGHMVTINLCATSNLQRDLRTTAPMRTSGEMLNYVDHAVGRLTRVVAGLQVFPKNMERNLLLQRHLYGAEAAYISLALAGLDNANAEVARIAKEHRNADLPLTEFLACDPVTAPYFKQLDTRRHMMIRQPENHYRGLTPVLAERRARECAAQLGLDLDDINRRITAT
jgi:adenylosuccinate lyase